MAGRRGDGKDGRSSLLAEVLMLKPAILSSFALAAIPFTQAAIARTVSIPFSASNFTDSLTIDNRLFPLVAGTTFTYRADTRDGCEVDLVYVTYETEVIDGVTTRKVHDQIFDGEICTTDPSALTEDTLDFYAQDDSNNVWYFGEDTFDYEGANSCTPGEGAWKAGVNGALPASSCSRARNRGIHITKNSRPAWQRIRRRSRRLG